MKKVVGVAVAVIVALAVVGFVSLRAIDASGQPAKSKPAATVKVTTPTKTYSLMIGDVKRSYEVIAPGKALAKTAPVIVMLSGIGSATVSGATAVAGEISRDDLVPYATSGQAEVVYPEPLYGSWNAIGCCGEAATKNVNDLAFLEALVAKVDPGHARQIDVVGYSNGARLAYRVACDNPGLFDEYAMVKGEPMPGCDIRKPVTILQLASVNDPEVPYKPGDHGSVESLPVTTLVGELRTTAECPANAAVTHSGEMTLTTWSGCAGGTRIALAAWAGGVHSFPRPPGSVPAASQVIWSFFTKTPIAPLPLSGGRNLAEAAPAQAQQRTASP
jgi:polyhydroxybutyrate depolymerase